MRLLNNLMKKKNTLLFQLLSSFMIVIILMTSFMLISYGIFKDKMHSEIVRYNLFNLTKSTTDYENYFSLIQHTAHSLYFNETVETLKKNINYQLSSHVHQEINNIASNQSLYLNNIVLHFRENDFILRKEGSTRAPVMFNSFITSKKYNYDYWDQYWTMNRSVNILPADHFTEINPSGTLNKGYLLPLVIKDITQSKLQMIMLLEANKLYQAFRPSISDKFFIIDQQRELIYSDQSLELPSFIINAQQISENNFGSHKEDGYYYFYAYGEHSQFTYVNIVSDKVIASQVINQNIVLISILVAAIVIGIGTSVYFSLKFDNPLRQIIQSVKQSNSNFNARRKLQIDEFDLIFNEFSNLKYSNETIKEEVDQKNSLLLNYYYLNKFKQIHTMPSGLNNVSMEDKPFIFILYKLHFKPEFHLQHDIDPQKFSYYVKKLIDVHASQNHKESITLQIEKEQIFSLVFGHHSMQPIYRYVESILNILNNDIQLYSLTVAITPLYEDSSKLTEAYKYALTLLNHRPLTDMNIIMTNYKHHSHQSYAFNGSERKQFEENLTSRNYSGLMQMIGRRLQLMQNKQLPAVQFAIWARDVYTFTTNVLYQLNLKDEFQSEYGEMPEFIDICLTVADYKSFFQDLYQQIDTLIHDKEDEKDPVIAFIHNYLENHFNEDISLDLLADKLNMTRSYLSTYFKIKAGLNFSDHLNNLRIHKAKELLSTTNMKIQDISKQVGYINTNSFIRLFKRIMGETPGEFRKNKRINDSSDN